MQYFYYPNFSFMQKFNDVIQKVDTKYISICADDDFMVKSNAEKCVDFLEQNQDELNDVLTRQQAQITLMERALRHLSSRINEVGNASVKSSEEESPPPHY